MKILLVYALDSEKGDISVPGHEVVFCRTGFGKVQAALASYKAIIEEKPDIVVNFGSSGALNHKLGEMFICSRFIDRDLSKIAIPGNVCSLDFSEELSKNKYFNSYSINHTVSTGDSFVTKPEDAGLDADVIDMEAFAIACACKKTNTPFVSVKYVSDIVGQNSLKAWVDKLNDVRTGLEDFFKELKL
jgi:adenosylhomocysteine nucleosidase